MSDDSQSESVPNTKDKSESKATLWVLCVFSVAYLGGLAFLLFQTAPCGPAGWQSQGPSEGFLASYVTCRTSNEIGDFLAGGFAPLAFLWLAGAVLIQSKELKAQKEELTLTRGEMAAMREVATAQAAEARASRQFIGTQTEIMQRQSAREELDDIHEAFEAHIRTFEACLVRFYGARIRRHDMGTSLYDTFKTTNGIPLAERPKKLLSELNKAIANTSHVETEPADQSHSIQIFGLDALDTSYQKLIEISPRLGPKSRAVEAETGLSEALHDTRRMIEYIRTDLNFHIHD